MVSNFLVKKFSSDEFPTVAILSVIFLIGIDTDELDAETENLEEEIVEFLIKEDTVVLEDD